MKNRITSLDSFKAVAAFLVVILHFSFKGIWAPYIKALARISVPFFFMVSGYFNYSEQLNSERIWRQVKKLFIMLVTVNLIYLAYRITYVSIRNWQNGNDVMRGIVKILLVLKRKQFLAANFHLAGHLWYVHALIYMLAAMALMQKFHLEKLVKWSVPILVAADLIVCKYALVLWGQTIFPRVEYEMLTKFIGVAYVYFMIGYFLGKERKHASTWFERVKHFIENHKIVIVGIIILFIIGNCVEYYLLSSRRLDVAACNYISTFFLSIILFLFLICNPLIGCKSVFCLIGKQYSMYIYLYHVVVARILVLVLRRTPLYAPAKWIMPVVIYGVTLGISAVVFCIIRIVRSRSSMTAHSDTIQQMAK